MANAALSSPSNVRDHRAPAAVARVATAPVNWNNDDLPGWAPEVPFPDLLDEMVAAGYAATELGGNFPGDPALLAAALALRDMTLCGSYLWLDLLAAEFSATASVVLDERLRLLAAVGCQDLVVAATMTPARVAIAGRVAACGRDGLSADEWICLGANLSAVAGLAAERTVRVHYHNHVGTFVETPAEVERLLGVLPDGVDLCFDTGHFLYGGGEPAAFVKRHGDRIGYVHLKDVALPTLGRCRERGTSFLCALREGIFCELGNGGAEVETLVDALLNGGFAGWLVVEQDTTLGWPTACARVSRRFLRERFGL